MIVETNVVNQAHAAHRDVWKEKSHDRTVDQLIEEMAELTKALLKKRRNLGTSVEVRAELADVCLALEFLGKDLGIDRQDLLTHVSSIAGSLEIKLRLMEPRLSRCDGCGEPATTSEARVLG